MDYEKVYKKALEIARAYYKENGEIISELACLSVIFPELKESEDERIRKNILELVKKHAVNHERCQMEAYLEKQKEQRIVLVDADSEVFKAGLNMGRQQKSSEWSEEDIADIFEKVGLAKIAREQGDDELINALQDAMLELSKSGNAEWSEEDKKIWQDIFELCNRFGYDDACRLLKSIRPQPHWKPSKQEKGALRTAIHILTEERSFPKAAAQLQNILDVFEGEESRKDWKPSEKQMRCLLDCVYKVKEIHNASVGGYDAYRILVSLYDELHKLL